MLSNLSKNRDRIKIQNIRWEEWKFLGKQVFRIKKRDKNFPRRAEARLEARVTRARFESYYRRIKRVLKTSQEGKKIEIAKRWCWLLDGNFFFLFFFYHLPGREAFAKCDYFTRKREKEREVRFLPLSFALCEQWKAAEMHFLNGTKRAVRLVRSFIHSFRPSDRSVLTLFVPTNLFFFFFLYLHPLVSIKGRHFLGKVAINGDWVFSGGSVNERYKEGQFCVDTMKFVEFCKIFFFFFRDKLKEWIDDWR